ncbi:hypothetical protein WA026_011511 [Henosepilachna vigintioctopunctata]|uniref:Uncharacterized protein n=1 Tax=Henosepilachna vigintioctopunctata TaxID=420089 RepID=A0AAW1TTV6_9CUCU
MDGESDTKTAEGESEEKVTEEPFLPFLSKRASLLEEAEVPTKYSEKEETIDSKDINLNQEYHLPLKSEEIAQEVVKDETEEIHDSALKPKEEKDMKVSSAETTELSEILENLIRDADPDSVLEECKKDDEVGSQILDGITDQIPTEKLDNEKEPLPEAEKVYIEDQVEQAKSKDVESRIVKEIQLDDIDNFIHQERSHTHREMESSVTDIKTDKKVEDVEKPVTEKPLDELQAKTIEAGIQSVQEFKEDKEETVSSSTDSNKIDIEKDKETKSNLDHRKELKLEAVEHIEDENKLEKGMMEAKEKDEDEEHDRAEVKCESEEPLMKTEKIKIDLTDKPEHAEAVLLKSTPESPVINVIPSLPALPTDIDKMELGRKSPKEREEDVAKIVASVATVLKSDAPLEEFHGKIPLTTNTPYGAYTTELRETHITTCDSPVHDSSILHEEPHQEATEEKIESSHSLEGKDDEKLDDHGLIRIDESEDPGTVHRMLVTASSEDGGEEIEICPAGTITFSKSSESSGRSSPENVSRKPSQSSSALDTISDHTTVKELVESQPKKEEIEEHASKTSIEHLQSSGESVEESETPKLYPELDIKKGIESLEDQIECKVSSSKKQDEPSEMQYSSDTSKEISQDTKEIHETVSDKVHSIFGSILSSASKIEETISHAITDTIHSAESTIDEGLKKVESEIDEVKHKITKIESDAVESLSEKKEKAEQLISDRLKESASSLEKVFDETDKEKNSLIQDAQTTLTRISAPLKDTFGDLLSNVVDSIKDKDDSLITAEDEKIVKSGEITIDEIQKVKEKPIPDEGQKETKSTETEKTTPEPSSNLYPSLESEMKEEGKEFDILTSTQTTKDATKSDASTHEEKILPTVDDVKGETDDTVKKGEKSEKVPSRQSEKTAPIILNGLDNEENVSDKTDAERSVDSGSTFKDEKQKHQVPISHDILSTKLPEIKSDVDERTETPQKKIISEIIPDAQYKSNVADSKISSPVDTINEPLSSPQKSLEAQQIPSTLQHDIDSISSSVENIKDSAKDLQKEIIKDLEEKKITLVDYTKDSLKGSKDKHESLIHKTEDSVKELEEKIVDLKEKQESVIDEIKDSVKDLEEELVEDLKERQESVVDKTKDFVKEFEGTGSRRFRGKTEIFST